MGEAPALPATRSHAEHDLRELRPLLIADDINEVVINPDGAVWVERADAEHMVRTGHQFPPGKVQQLSKHLAGETMNRRPEPRFRSGSMSRGSSTSVRSASSRDGR
jgi:hypothetical protein